MTVSTEDYTLARRLFLYVPATASVIARDFVDFALSDAGQNVVRAAGFVDLLPDCDATLSRCRACPRDYLESVRGACRVSIDFRFEHDSLELDTRALRDLPRVAAMLARTEYAGRSLVLLGFSDGSGARATAVSLSQQRADIVAQQLRARGLHILVERGFGPDMPVADDSTEEGRERNRRVEAWLR
jgi:phosphate transport system substrate-binding protein